MHQFIRNIIVSILTWEASRALHKWRPRIILVSGSVGKTTTKDAIFQAIKGKGRVSKSQKSFNSEIGVPLTILGLPNAWSNPTQWLANLYHGFLVPYQSAQFPDTLVLEVGSDHPHDIAQLLRWLKPDIAVLTNLPDVPVHVEHFTSPEELRREDALVVSALDTNGVYVANADDDAQVVLIEEARARGVKVVSYGFREGASVRGSHLSVRYAKNEGVDAPLGMEFYVEALGEKSALHIKGVLGAPLCSAVLAALAVGLVRGNSLQTLAEEIAFFASPSGRMRIIEGKGGMTIIDDSYNSSPVALAAALLTLRTLTGTRKIAMLGDMLELGSFSEEEHWKAGRLAGEFLDELITVGVRARLIAEGAKSSGLPEACIHHFDNSILAGRFMESISRVGDIVLVKGSQGSGENLIRMERATKLLMAHPDTAKEMLVRQEEEWSRQYAE